MCLESGLYQVGQPEAISSGGPATKTTPAFQHHKPALSASKNKATFKMNNIFKNWFGGFLRGRRATLLFGRGALLETFGERGRAEAIPESLSRNLLKAAGDDISAALLRFESHEDGLSAPEAHDRLMHVGPNEVEHEKPLPWWLHLWHCYKNPFNLLLTVLAVVSYLTEDTKATVVIGTMVVLSTIIRFVQEGRSNRSAARLKAMVSNTATVIRRNLGTEAAEVAEKYFEAILHTRRPAAQVEVPIRELVRGRAPGAARRRT